MICKSITFINYNILNIQTLKITQYTDINECVLDTMDSCSVNETCTNTPGSYNCHCKPNYSYDMVDMKCMGWSF